MRKRVISILGGRAGNCGPATLALAEAIGAELGSRGFGVMTGGDSGVALAANRGCRSAAGETLALLKWNRLQDCGPEVTWAIPTSMDLARSNVLNWSGDGIIAFEGRYGTLSEIALALDTARPLIVLGEHAFLSRAALDVPTCQVITALRPQDAAAIVDAMERLIALVPPPPVRPGAALFPGELRAAGQIVLRPSAHADLGMFQRAFTDTDVLAWWDLGAGDGVHSRWPHERCLVITELGRAVGFIDYHADPDPDFDHIGVDIVMAAAADRGRGIGTAALASFARGAFEAGHHRITVVPSPDNGPAIRCYEKVGFRRVGVMRAYERYRGRWRDALLLDLLPGDLPASAPEGGTAELQARDR
jgi:uncharacterized protein (TIGR00725 family)